MREANTLRLEKLLQFTWWGLLVFRFLLPIYDNPLTHLFSDPARHWQNGLRLLQPDIMGSIDPKLYQLYIYLIHHLSFGNAEMIGALTGLLCVAMAVVWYQLCRELFSPLLARFLGCLIAACPSFLGLYTLFINETLMLVLMGAAFWCSLRALRSHSQGWLASAIIFWVLACFTRSLMIPLALGVIWYILLRLPRWRWRMASLTAVLSLMLAIPAGWHSWQKLHVVAPFGFPQMNEFYFYTGAKIFEIDTEQGRYGFSSPSFYYPIGMPFFEYQSCRADATITAKINTQNGIADWDTAINKMKAKYTAEKFWCGLKENFIFLLAANSWPDSAVEWGYNWIYFLNFHLRWMWVPLMLLLLSKAPSIKRSEKEQLILSCAIGLLFLLLFQMMVMNEGRYRKPLEILLIFTSAILLRPNTAEDAQGITLWQFLWRCYFLPVLSPFLAMIGKKHDS